MQPTVIQGGCKFDRLLLVSGFVSRETVTRRKQFVTGSENIDERR